MSAEKAGRTGSVVPPQGSELPPIASVRAHTPAVSYDFEAGVRRVVEGETGFGRFIKPLIDRLNNLPADRRTENLETFKLIYGFLKGKSLARLEYTQDDVVFMMGDDIGNLIRRPILNSWYADQVDAAIEGRTDAEGEIKSMMGRYLRASGWSRFVQDPTLRDTLSKDYPGDVYVDTLTLSRDLNVKMEEAPLFSVALAEAAFRICRENMDRYGKPNGAVWEAEREAAKRSGRPFRFHTDPGHMFNAGTNMGNKKALIEMKCLGRQSSMPPFRRETEFMLVEDNPFHFVWADMLDAVGNTVRYAPPKGAESQEPMVVAQESRGYYMSAERALEVMEKRGRPPALLLTDIELPGMNGIELIRRLHDRETASGGKPIIAAVYSSNVYPYEDELGRLTADGMIVGAWHKARFNVRDMIDAVNREIQRRGE